ncbi:MAG: asparagine synthase (glutamine-hydrolyzing) [Candidatus Aenigmatarchaeota archaeon]|nr:MAG: asparagine synthase (glutamine-hydrolyzing) [Candidatus Aenigmarchaeota archaeon]
MCGICGFNWEDMELVKRCVQVLSHRGPDDKGVYTDSHVSLGHARLSIIDLSKKGKQPLSNEDGSVWITYNGEIYNYRELRRALEKKGHKFFSNTDTEVIVHAYEEWGLDFPKKLRGMFALGIWDSQRKKLVLARDPIGKKPLYYYYKNGKFVFASEIKAILEVGIPRNVNLNALLCYVAFGYSLGIQTLFDRVKKLPGGSLLVLDENGMEIKRYWDIQENLISGSESFFVKRLSSILTGSTKIRMLASDVPIGSFLSGGIDSSSVVALARKFVDYEMHTFSVGFDVFSELEYAKITAEHLGTNHHEIFLDGKKVLKEIGKIAWHFDEPLGDSAIIPNYFLSKEARKYVKVVLAGEGGDELFGGYPHYKNNLNALGKPSLVKFIGKIFLCFPSPGFGVFGKAKRYFEYITQPDLLNLELYSTRIASNSQIKSFLRFPFQDPHSFAIQPSFRASKLNHMLIVDCKNLLPEKYLMKADKATMANSVEERLPLLDKNLIEFAFQIPGKLKIKNGNEKYILRKAVSSILPKEIIQREKTGFNVPANVWINKEMKEFAESVISESELIKKYFRTEKIPENLKWEFFALGLWEKEYFRR